MGDPAARRFLIVAGEPSGDAHAARLVEALRDLGRCEVRGVAGPALRAAGVHPLARVERLAVLGFAGVVARLPDLLAARRALLAEFDAFRPDAVVLVDYPGFNLRLGPQLKRRGARVFYYIAPQVWAWHPQRAAAMAAWVDELAVVFPFEEEIFRAAGVRTTFVGHPLLDDLAPEVPREALAAATGVRPGGPLLGLLPGSRRGEIARLLPVQLEAARRLMRDRPGLATVVAAAPALDAAHEAAALRAGATVVRGRTHAVQAFATACAVASGTATLETALFGTPLAVVFRTGRLNYEIARRVVRLTRIGLPNIVAGEDVAPELIQDALTPSALEAALQGWLDDPAARERAAARLARVRERLGAPGASARAAARLWALAGGADAAGAA